MHYCAEFRAVNGNKTTLYWSIDSVELDSFRYRIKHSRKVSLTRWNRNVWQKYHEYYWIPIDCKEKFILATEIYDKNPATSIVMKINCFNYTADSIWRIVNYLTDILCKDGG